MVTKFVRVALAVVVVATVAVPAAAETGTEPSLDVSLDDAGDAEVMLTLTYDLTSDDQREAFRTLTNDSDVQTYVQERFGDRMSSVATKAENATGREMSVEDATIDVSETEDGQTGVVKLGVDWRGFAAVDGDRLVVTEPFASGFETDRRVTLAAPDGYELTNATPEPTTTDDGRLVWDSGTSLDGVEVAFDSVESGPDGETSDEDESATGGVPGFGAGLTVVSLLAAALFALRR